MVEAGRAQRGVGGAPFKLGPAGEGPEESRERAGALEAAEDALIAACADAPEPHAAGGCWGSSVEP